MDKKNIRIAVYPGYDDMLKDHIFDLNSAAAQNLRGLPVLQRYVVLKDFLEKKGMEIHTYDVYKNLKDVDVWLMLEMSLGRYFFMIRNLINPKKVLPMIIEPPVVMPWEWKYLRYWTRLHKVILTWSYNLIKEGSKFMGYPYTPFSADKSKYDYYRSKPKKNLCLLMQSNKNSRVKGELYSLRRNIVRYFEKRGDNLLDLYGYGWNSPHTHHLGRSKPFYTDLYRGIAENKWETFAEYPFVFCIQNSIPSGDFEVDPFMTMATGGVPIYLPPPGFTKLIPENTFINYAKFNNLDDLVSYLQSIIGTREYENYRKRGMEYVYSPKFPFALSRYCEDVYAAIKKQLE